MGKMKLYLWQIILYLFILISCSRNLSINEIPLPVEVQDENFSIFTGDCRGDSNVEIILASENSILIYSKDGELLLYKPLGYSFFNPSFLSDLDKDGKEDLVLGTVSASPNRILAINGMGHTISSFREEKSYHDFSSIDPQFVLNGKIYALARPADDESARGILCFDSFSMKLLWTFYTPDPLMLTLLQNEIMILSYFTHGNGTFVQYGHEDDFYLRRDYEVKGMLIEIGINGEALSEFELFSSQNVTLGTLLYSSIGDSKNEVLLNHYFYENDQKYKLFIINVNDGLIQAESELVYRLFLGQNIISAKGETFTVVSERSEDMFFLSIYNSFLDLVLTEQLSGSFSLGPVLISENGESFIQYLLSENGLYTVNEQFEIKQVIHDVNVRDMAIYKEDGVSRMVILNAHSLHLLNNEKNPLIDFPK